MLKQLFRDESALARHRAGLFAEERERYLQQSAEHGATRAVLRVKANELLSGCVNIYHVTHLRESICRNFRRLPANGYPSVKEPRPSDDWLTLVDHGSASWDGGACRQPNRDFKVILNGT